MADSAETGLTHVTGGSSLQAGSRRGQMVARGRLQAAAGVPHYRVGAEHYAAGRFWEAAAAFRLAAVAGHAESQYLLSTLLDAEEVPASYPAEAQEMELRAAEAGHVFAQANVSFRCHAAGDFDRAFAWCERAANSGLAWAQYNLGLMYRKGEGTAASDEDAARMYRQAAEQQYVEAQTKLAELYYLGEGVPRSDALAASWYRRAADAGDAEAQFQLSHFYAVGQGVEQDYVQSRAWIQRSAASGHAAALRELSRRRYRDA